MLVKFQTVTQTIDTQQIIKNYFEYAQVIDDIGINELLINGLAVFIENNVFKTYANFDCLYDYDYSKQLTENAIINNIPELSKCMLKNNLMISKIFREYKNIQVSNDSTNILEHQYEGLNVLDNFKTSKNTNHFQVNDIMNTMLQFDINFKSILDVLKKDIEKILRTIY